MFQKAITKYGLAFHLAMLAALPSALAPFLSDHALGRLVLWLALYGALWLYIEPSLRLGEHLSVARIRVWSGILKDPILWFFILYVVLCAVRWLNSGIELSYDAQDVSWEIADPLWPIMPASVGDEGFLPFAVAVGALVVVLGLRHAVGLAARVSFMVSGSFVAGVGGWASAIAACIGFESFASNAASGFGIVREPLMGALWGIWFLASLSAGVQAELRDWRRGRPLICLALAGNLAGLFFFSPPYVSCSYLALGVLYAVYSWIWIGYSGTKGAVVRSIVLFLIGIAMAASLLFALAPDSVKESKVQGFDSATVWCDKDREADATLNGMAKRMWLEEPWCGVGLGAFPLKAQFVGKDADWEVVPSSPKRAINGYWTLISERGNVMCGLFVVGLGMMLWFWGSRLFDVVFHAREMSSGDPFPFSCPPVVWLPVLFIPLLSAEGVFASVFSVRTLLLPVMAMLALATASFPRRIVGEQQKENTDGIQ